MTKMKDTINYMQAGETVACGHCDERFIEGLKYAEKVIPNYKCDSKCHKIKEEFNEDAKMIDKIEEETEWQARKRLGEKPFDTPPPQSYQDPYIRAIKLARQEALEELKGEIGEELKNIDISVVGFTKTLERRKGNREAFEACLSLINNKQKI